LAPDNQAFGKQQVQKYFRISKNARTKMNDDENILKIIESPHPN